ncbi:MAG: efflux RND transporter periplasmic adaptor subunit [Bermanella sp.]
MNIKKIILPMLAFGLGVIATYGYVSIPQNSIEPMAENKPLYWVAPMDANYRRDVPGLSPMGMELVPFYADETDSEPGTVKISASIENSLGVKVANVLQQDMHRNIQSAGFLQYDESSIQHYHVRVNGWLEKLYVNSVGDKIKTGQKLFDLYSPELVYAQEEYLAALQTNNKTLIQAALLKLRALGVSNKQVNSLEKNKKVRQTLTFYAVRPGYISNLNVRQGMYIQPQLEIMATGDLSSIWVIAEVFERQASWLEIAAPVEMKLAAFPHKKWQGKVDYIFPVLNSENRTVQARIVFENPDLKLKPNMFAALNIQVRPLNNAIVIPSEAVIYSSDMQRVVLALGNGQFRSTRVITGIQSMGFTQIIEGLEDGQKVVQSAQFLIDSESSINADLSRMQHEKPLMSSSMDNMSMEEKAQLIMAIGVVTALEGKDAIEIKHQPIKELNWPVMQMSFDVQEGVSLSLFSEGDVVEFSLQKSAQGSYVIGKIEKRDTTKKGE